MCVFPRNISLVYLSLLNKWKKKLHSIIINYGSIYLILIWGVLFIFLSQVSRCPIMSRVGRKKEDFIHSFNSFLSSVSSQCTPLLIVVVVDLIDLSNTLFLCTLFLVVVKGIIFV